MRNCFVLLAGLALFCAAPVFAAEEASPPTTEKPEAAAPKTRTERLDELFINLKREHNEKAAERIAARIWQEWNQSGSAVVDLMMQWSQQAVEKKKFDVALDFLDQVVTLSPDYAEGWNRRATVHYMMHNFSKSMADIERTLELEPRHFGALSGLAQIMRETERKELALDAYQRVLVIYPMLRNAQNEVGTLSDELTGEGI
uniref:tetratricopeptide repeat protein n=1 Tax=Mesorhizobium sp. LHD-90 TaxID=3071414 RepID=UPI0035A95551